MQKLKQNLKGFYLAVKKDNFNFQISKKNLNEKIKNFSPWMERQINSEFKNFQNKKNEIDQTIKNLKDQTS